MCLDMGLCNVNGFGDSERREVSERGAYFKDFFGKLAEEEGYIRCSSCDRWIRTDSANFNGDLFDGGLCEECFDEDYGRELYGTE